MYKIDTSIGMVNTRVCRVCKERKPDIPGFFGHSVSKFGAMQPYTHSRCKQCWIGKKDVTRRCMTCCMPFPVQSFHYAGKDSPWCRKCRIAYVNRV